MKILYVSSWGANELWLKVKEMFPESERFNFLKTFLDEGEDIAFKKLNEALDRKPDILLCFLHYSIEGSTKRHMEFIERAKKTIPSYIFLFEAINTEQLLDRWKLFDKVFAPNFERTKLLKKIGYAAEFLPPACSEEVHIRWAPFDSNHKLISSVCVYIGWYNVQKQKRTWISGGPDRSDYIFGLLSQKIPVNICGGIALRKLIEDCSIDTTSLTFSRRVHPYIIYTLSKYKTIFNAVFRTGELSINRRFCEILGIGTTQLYPACPHFDEFCRCFLGEVPTQDETPFILYQGVDDFVAKANNLLREPEEQMINRRKKASVFRERWSNDRLVKIIVGEEENPAIAMKTKEGI